MTVIVFEVEFVGAEWIVVALVITVVVVVELQWCYWL